MSLHKSKGLSADIVIVTGFNEGLIPSSLRGNEVTEAQQARYQEEQRRLFYVAITRAKRSLVLSSVTKIPKSLVYKMGAKVVGIRGEIADVITSTFLNELGPETPTPVSGANWQY